MTDDELTRKRALAGTVAGAAPSDYATAMEYITAPRQDAGYEARRHLRALSGPRAYTDDELEGASSPARASAPSSLLAALYALGGRR
jgi:hypothetical protein